MMRVALLESPWAADATHIIEADTAASWRSQIVEIPPDRYAAAIWIDGTDRPVPVQIFNGASCPHSITSADSFLVIMTGFQAVNLADIQWNALSNFPAQYAEAQRFVDFAMVPMIHDSTHSRQSSSRDMRNGRHE